MSLMVRAHDFLVTALKQLKSLLCTFIWCMETNAFLHVAEKVDVGSDVSDSEDEESESECERETPQPKKRRQSSSASTGTCLVVVIAILIGTD